MVQEASQSETSPGNLLLEVIAKQVKCHRPEVNSDSSIEGSDLEYYYTDSDSEESESDGDDDDYDDEKYQSEAEFNDLENVAPSAEDVPREISIKKCL
ncbi:uncharacterized protein N7473_005960 [Penicillium subrubescens]|uniref:Uncharacterized protein n=1 Tax=Penicillium subrubescens TaxID=1316194 RepID=A0A1Q5UEY5_9EURO|nr:uncharacterized protein N7473_005960 [Penicillium subrubescens]KAJ5896561.1 hypothetical protein N7473_005960 [Penicillium subrubescens]OKP11022.1 hypothetical protein PENSUB_3543 [Penicillium subrubescens]